MMQRSFDPSIIAIICEYNLIINLLLADGKLLEDIRVKDVMAVIADQKHRDLLFRVWQ